MGTSRPPVDVIQARGRGERWLHRHREGEELQRAIVEQSKLHGGRAQLPEADWPAHLEDYVVFLPEPTPGSIRIVAQQTISDDELTMVHRFGEVFGFAYQRWQDLQEKEAQNHRLAIDAAVQPLRAEVQAMDETAERILSLLTDSLNTVDIRFDGCETILLRSCHQRLVDPAYWSDVLNVSVVRCRAEKLDRGLSPSCIHHLHLGYSSSGMVPPPR